MITINNMSMPKSCADCRCTFDAFDGSTECKLGAKMIDWSKRPEDCPLVEFERPKGNWKGRRYYRPSTNQYDCEMSLCSECGEEYSYDAETGISITDYSFCPNCGALMKKGGAE